MTKAIYLFLGIIFSTAAFADVSRFEEEDKLVDQIGYTSIDVLGNPVNLAYVLLIEPTAGESALCTYGGVILFDVYDSQSPENKLFYNTLLAAKISNTPVWLTISHDDSNNLCALTGVRLSGN